MVRFHLSFRAWQGPPNHQLRGQQTEAARVNRKPAPDRAGGAHLEHGNGCLLNSTAAHSVCKVTACEGREEGEGARDRAGALWLSPARSGHQGRLDALSVALEVGRCGVCTMPLISKRNGEEPIGWHPPAKDSISPALVTASEVALPTLWFTEDIWARQGSTREHLAQEQIKQPQGLI